MFSCTFSCCNFLEMLRPSGAQSSSVGTFDDQCRLLMWRQTEWRVSIIRTVFFLRFLGERRSPRSAVAVSGQRKHLTLFGLEEGVGQRDGVHSGHPRVVVELGVDVEEDGHVHLLVRVQALLLEAETLQTHEQRSRVTRVIATSSDHPPTPRLYVPRGLGASPCRALSHSPNTSMKVWI